MTDQKPDPDDELGPDDAQVEPDTTEEHVAALPEVREDTVIDDPEAKDEKE